MFCFRNKSYLVDKVFFDFRQNSFRYGAVSKCLKIRFEPVPMCCQRIPKIPLFPPNFAKVYRLIRKKNRVSRRKPCGLAVYALYLRKKCPKMKNSIQNLLFLRFWTRVRLVEMIRLELTTYTLRTYRSTG